MRHASPSFDEDPTRVLIGMQQAGRFNMGMHPDTITMAKNMLAAGEGISKEAHWHEWSKWARLSQTPSSGISLLFDTDWAALLGYPN